MWGEKGGRVAMKPYNVDLPDSARGSDTDESTPPQHKRKKGESPVSLL